MTGSQELAPGTASGTGFGSAPCIVRRKVVVVLKGYPRLSETFIAQEILGLENAGIDIAIVSLRRPTDHTHHAVHEEIQAPVTYLPEYLHEEPLRVLRGLFSSTKRPGFFKALRNFLRDFSRDITRNRIRRFGQAAVLANEWPDDAHWLHAHFIHTPALPSPPTPALYVTSPGRYLHMPRIYGPLLIGSLAKSSLGQIGQ